jgi:hypothetical protein
MTLAGSIVSSGPTFLRQHGARNPAAFAHFRGGVFLEGLAVKGCKSTLVTWRHAGHSYPIKPGSFASGSILTTSFITALHRGHAKRLPFGNFDTPHARDSHALL